MNDPTPSPSSGFCTTCGAPWQMGVRFCNRCGQLLEAAIRPGFQAKPQPAYGTPEPRITATPVAEFDPPSFAAKVSPAGYRVTLIDGGVSKGRVVMALR